MNYLDILQEWCQGIPDNSSQLHYLLKQELANPQTAKVWGITEENGLEKIKLRAQLFTSVQQEVREVCHGLGLQKLDQILSMLWRLWLPLCLQLVEVKQSLKRPVIQGILGGQGTGKTTLAKVSRLILKYLGYIAIDISIDDFYKTYAERQKLQKKDPRLIWRGPPGTHDVELAIQVLEQLRQPIRHQPILLPRFDKSLWNGAGDRIEFESIDRADIVLFEGWFVGVCPIDEKMFDCPPLPIITKEDQQFAKDMNNQLKNYLPLWGKLDRLLILAPINYQLSQQWRKEAEQKMIASGKPGMSDGEIEQFVEYFWRSLHPELFMNPLIKNPQLVDLVVEIKADHSVGQIFW
ncbi:glycerate kinase [Rippkaea orientalis PCC 8801]|uniref:Glycerate kinase n=1 Tax=Rippkaea orientalis (strain PCC 8801 / RF-1) TaxID=41431 RepID=B7JY14_RIPO1|nr:glycerate kinase [Rippkaea orientalis]ACK65978.1 glycerate kinase [Rippkaea orientalis PCC 8801]